MTQWRYTAAGEELKTIVLHDCVITGWEQDGDCLSLIFEDGFSVLDENEHNRTGSHKQTGRSAVVLKDGKLISSQSVRKDI